MTDADRVRCTALPHCYSSDKVAATSSKTELDVFGSRLDDSDPNFALFGHKCMWPVDIQVKSAAGGEMTWASTPENANGRVIAPFDGLYDVCFSLKDPSWTSLHPSSNEFVAQLTRIQYEVVCDPLDQIDAFPDPEGHCEVNDISGGPGSYQGLPVQQSHKCTRLGNRANPCDTNHRTWEMLSCDDSSCESLEGHSSEYSDRYGASTDKGVKYTFDHDSTASKNSFSCATHEFNNVNMKKAGMLFGDSTDVDNKYICAQGAQDTPCDPLMGEIVHNVDTCSDTSYAYQDNEALKA